MRWLGVDGEGVGRNPHRYVLLCACDAKGRGDYIEDVRGLSTVDCLEFFLRQPARARLAGYYLGYDWTKILADLPNDDIYRLLRPELRAIPRDEGGGFTRVRYRGYRLHWLSGSMTIARRGRRVTVWDLGKFFQCKFVDAIGSLPNVDKRMIARMKEARSTFSDDDLDRILVYCREECRALAMLAEDLEAAHKRAGVVPKVWYGPGSTASVVLRRYDIHKRRGQITAEIRDVAERAFFGGRFEHSTIGRVENVYGYDIKSAYPAQCRRLPCLEHATWRYTSRERDLARARYAAVHFTVDDIGAAEAWGPLPCRLADHSIVFARGGFSGWVWLDEYRAACEGFRGIRFLDAWILSPRCKHRPFAFVDELYRLRATGNADEKRIYKLILNSLYGKLAQRIGEPKFASVVWAGMITSGTRAELLRMIYRHKDRWRIVALATDGLYSTEDIACPTQPALGEWEKTPHGAMWFVRPGIYWSEQDETLRARGLGRAHLRAQVELVKRALEHGEPEARLGRAPFFGGARQCVRERPDGKLVRNPLYGEWYDRPCRIRFDPAPKRAPDWSLRVLPGLESRPYAASTSPDGEFLAALAELFGVLE